MISQKIPDSGIVLLEERGYELVYLDQEYPLETEELLKVCRDADALLCLLSDQINADFLQQCHKLQVVANYAVGYENIDVPTARERGIVVTNTPDVLSKATADLAFGLLLAVSRRIVEAHQYILEGEFDGWKSTLLLGTEISGKTLGVLGAGRIGTEMAKRAIGFDMDVIYHSRSPKSHLDDTGCRWVDLETLLSESDFISLHLPLTTETKLIINAKTLARMKQGVYLINTGRGKLVDEQALVTALRTGQLAGAGLDVYELEPDIHPELTELNNVVLLPHIGSATTEARDKMAGLCASAIIDVLEGRTPPNQV
ncbi:MAG: 2-hydroxyacid dehydrogenase [Candidatus Kariarchaeaceae archaeon]